MWVQSLGWGDPLEEEMATHSNILAWKIPWTEDPGGQQSMAAKSWTRLSIYTHTHTEAQCRPGSISGSGRSPGEGNSNSLQYSCLENRMDRGAWLATVHSIERAGHN